MSVYHQELISLWIEGVQNEFYRLVHDKIISKAETHKNVFQLAAAKGKVEIEKLENDPQIIAPFKLPTESEEDHSSLESQANQAKVYSTYSHWVPKQILKETPSIPSMFTWVPLKMNVLVDNEEVLHHIPYMDDDAVDDEHYMAELLNIYDGLVHKVPQGENYFTSEILAELVDSIVNDSPLNKRLLSLDLKIDLDIVFDLIRLVVPFRGSPEWLRKRYDKYISRKTKQTNFTETIPNIDSDISSPYPREKALHTFQNLFCNRCFMYDCHTHYYITPNYRAVYSDTCISAACGKNCFLNLDIAKDDNFVIINNKWSERNDLLNLRKNLLENNNYATLLASDIQTDHWTGSEVTLFNVLLQTTQINFCMISKSLGTKTCAEVFVYSTKLDLREIEETIDKDWDEQLKKKKEKKKSNKSSKFWVHHGKKHKQLKKEFHAHFDPCDHLGSPCDKTCPCIKVGNFCEKFCNCSPECTNRFPGCRCKGTCTTKMCPCVLAVRECDPDLCTVCGPEKLNLNEIRCKNISIQRGLLKHLLLGTSDVAGWGVFLNDTAEKNDFISEYRGEIITQDEADRRGKVYDRHKSSFLFNLNNEYVIDAKKQGNKIRFANHSVQPNCYAKVMLVNGDHRIGIFANRRIRKYEELFFDYRYGPTEQLKFVGIEREQE